MKTKIFTLLLLAFLGLSTANAQVGIGTTNPDASAMLDLNSTEKGFLPPRMDTAERNAIASPATGLVVYNTDVNCLQWYNGTGWFDACSGSTFGSIPDNATCAAATISVTPCSAVPGASLSASQPHPLGTLYDWTDATNYMGGTTTAALVEIGGQCWFGRNTNTPTSYEGLNDDDGFYDNSTSELAVGEGRLYQWAAAMNGSTTERAQGVCPSGWHVPSDCEWMFLENALGMTVADQEIDFMLRGSGAVGAKISASGDNSSGFTSPNAGLRYSNGGSALRGTNIYYYTSSIASGNLVYYRYKFNSTVGLGREVVENNSGFSVRCLKD